MKIQYMSDLHMEFAENSSYLQNLEIPVTGDILVLAGDIFNLKNTVTPPLDSFWDWASKNYRQVILIPGNHEYYLNGDVVSDGLQWKRMFRDNVGYYQNQVVNIDDTDLILSTMWSNVPSSEEYFVFHGLTDFRQTRFEGRHLTIENYNYMHQCCLDFIVKSVKNSTAANVVVVTHHLPSFEVVASQFRHSNINSAFATELGNFISYSRIDAWIYGHSHTNIDIEIGNTKVISNQLGYVFCNDHIKNGFDPQKYIEIG